MTLATPDDVIFAGSHGPLDRNLSTLFGLIDRAFQDAKVKLARSGTRHHREEDFDESVEEWRDTA